MTTMMLNWPEWQGGMNPDYQMGNRVLRAIVPEILDALQVNVPVSPDANKKSGIDGGVQLANQQQFARDALVKNKPQRVITLGGDCAVSEVPFDYLNGRYPDDFGVIWLDAHPDISTISDTHHLHEMVVADLLHASNSEFAQQVQNPLRPAQVFFAGLTVAALRPMDQLVRDMGLATATPQQLRQGHPIQDWLVAHAIRHVALHFDLDVLDPDDFRSILPAKPHFDRAQFGAAIGSMTLDQVIALLTNVSHQADLVGLSIAEHMPWDALNLHRGLNQLPIFNGGRQS
ncbi:arginase family protein [Lacticaseibacillus songhuajiangensis]|jgi:arginase|uniref:arginase family protein n=1 Tax=Lacticaseibacillus songhuajiangensis TaxID=1296539 RepID=UPI000F76FB03|nr:arginase family protein [Lacticaseibacillus songhuajiangensis]